MRMQAEMTFDINRYRVKAVVSVLAAIMMMGIQACASKTETVRQGLQQDYQAMNSTRVSKKKTALDARYQKDADLMLLLLVAEVAAQQGDLATSVQSYLKASRLTDDAQIAERATRVASFARDYQAAMQAAERWAELEPDNLDVQHSLVILYLRNNMLDKAVDAVDLVLKMTAKSKIQGFSHLVALLNNEADKDAVLALMDRVVINYHNNPHAHFAYARLAFQSKILHSVNNVPYFHY